MTVTWPKAVVAAALLGAASAAAFEPLAVPYLMVATVAGYFALLRRLGDLRRRSVALTGFVFGLAFMGPLIWWMNAVDRWAWVALVLIEALFLALITVLLRTAMRARFWPLWAAAVWTAGELARGAFPFSGFPWGRLAHASLDTVFAPWARLVALPGTTFVMALTAALLVCALERRKWLPAATAIALPLIGLVLPVGIADGGATKRVALVQGDTPGDFLQWPRAAIFRLHVAETEKLDEPVDLVIWPENGSDLDVFTNEYARTTLQELSARVGAPILVGAILDGPTDDTAYNASVVVDADGPRDEIYLKQNVVPYGEYVPFRRQLGPLVPRFDRDIPRDLVPGDRPGAMRVAQMSVGNLICWDVAYDAAVHGAVDLGAQFLAVQTSNASFMDFGRGIQPQQQWAISRLRAIETGRWVTVASTNGISGAVAPDGAVAQRAPVKRPATIVQEIRLADGTTPATRWGGTIAIVLCLMAAAGWASGAREVRRERR